MRHRVKKVKLGRDKDHRIALLKNLATSIIIYEKVKTTKAKAKAVAPVVEKLINVAKKENEMNAIREINRIVLDKNAGKKLIKELKKKYQDRKSGYTRIINIGFRSGDAAPMVQIELV